MLKRLLIVLIWITYWTLFYPLITITLCLGIPILIYQTIKYIIIGHCNPIDALIPSEWLLIDLQEIINTI